MIKPQHRPGRPKSSPLTRNEQLRQAKRAQRERDQLSGLVLRQFKLHAGTAECLQRALSVGGFEDQLKEFLEESVIDSHAYANLKLLCWNRSSRYVSGRDAFALYERNWRFVDRSRMQASERELISR